MSDLRLPAALRLLLLLLLPLSLLAQATGSISGTALDGLGNLVAGAMISACPPNSPGIPCSPVIASTTSNGAGAFSVTVPVGTYLVTIFRLGIVASSSTVVVSPSNIIVANNVNYTGSVTFGQPIISAVSTGTAPFSIASTTQVANLNVQLHGGLAAPASAIVGISDTQTLANKTLTSPTTTGADSGAETLTNKTLDISANTLKTATNTAGHYARNNGTQYVDATIPSADVPAGTSCGANNFATGINAALTPACAQPAFSNLSGNIATSQMNSGTGASSSTFWRGDATWATVPASGVSESFWAPAGEQTAVGVLAKTIFPNAHTLIRATLSYTVAPTGCTTNGVVKFRDATSSTDLVTFTNVNGTAFYDSGVLSTALTAGHTFTWEVTTAASGCTGFASGFGKTVILQ